MNHQVQRKKVGWLCPYLPTEMLTAAGLDPVRISPQPEPRDKTGGILPANFCLFLRSVFNSGLHGRFDHLAGVVFVNSCDGMRRLRDLWSSYIDTPFLHLLEVPRNRDDAAVRYFARQLHALQTRLEGAFGLTITETDLQKAIQSSQRRRQSVRALFNAQKSTPPAIEGSRLLALCLEEDDPVTQIAPNPDLEPVSSPRLLILGEALDRPDLFRMIEQAGGGVVLFDTCLGWHAYEESDSVNQPSLDNLARQYLRRPHCPRQPGFQERLVRLDQLTREYAIDGVIQAHPKFCDYGLFETPHLSRFLKDKGLPFLALEHDYYWSDTGRVRLRVEAFLEMLQGPLF